MDVEASCMLHNIKIMKCHYDCDKLRDLWIICAVCRLPVQYEDIITHVYDHLIILMQSYLHFMDKSIGTHWGCSEEPIEFKAGTVIGCSLCNTSVPEISSLLEIAW